MNRKEREGWNGESYQSAGFLETAPRLKYFMQNEILALRFEPNRFFLKGKMQVLSQRQNGILSDFAFEKYFFFIIR